MKLVSTLASYVPPLVVRRFALDPAPPSTPRSDRFPAAVLFTDISGFTPLAERLAERPSGAEDLSSILNDYSGRFNMLVSQHGGQVVDFAGDAAIVLWPGVEKDDDLRELTRRAAACGLRIREELNGYPVATDVRLTIRVSLAAGEVWTGCVGGAAGRWSLLVAGDPVDEVYEAQSHARPGDVVLAPAARSLLAGGSETRPLGDGHALLESLAEETPPVPSEPFDLDGEAEAALRTFIPLPVLANLDAGHRGWLAELRRVSVLFVSVKQLDFSDRGILERVQSVAQLANETILRFGGSLKQFVVDEKGSTLLAAWGLPACTHEDDPMRALRAGLEIRAGLNELGLSCSAGITTGRVFCGDRGSEQRREYAVVGRVVNQAARLMQVKGNDLLCDAVTREAAGGTAETTPSFQSLPPFRLKGSPEPVRIYRVEPPGAGRERPSLVGRRSERDALEGALRSFQSEGSPRVVVIEGEPGIGKSRLVADLIERARARRLPTLVGFGSAIESSNPYHAWRPVLDDLLGLDLLPDDREVRRRHVARALERLGPEIADLAPLLNAVLPLDFPQTPFTEQMQGEVRAGNLRELLVRLIGSESARPGSPDAEVPTTGRRSVLVLEDAHWFDSASWALARRVSRELPAVQMVLATRPLVDPVPAEFGQMLEASDTRVLRPTTLAREDTEQLLADRLGVPSIETGIVDLVHERAAGNPFFTEELAFALRDSSLVAVEDGICRAATGAAELESLIPDSVQGAVATRIDQLPPPQQLALKVASVIGRSFALDLLADIYPVEADRPRLAEFFDNLERLDLVVADRSDATPRYLFKHVISRDVAYDLLLFSQRRELHREVAQWYERRHADDLAPIFPILAEHWSQTDDRERAVVCLDGAGEQALASDANREAIGFLERAEEWDEPAATETASPTRTRRDFGLSEAYFRLGRIAESEAHARRALESQGHPAPRSDAKLAAEALGLAAHQLRRRLSPRQRAAQGEQREAAVLAYRLHNRFGRVAFLQMNTNLAVHATLHSLRAAESIGPSDELAHAYSTISVAAGLIPVHKLARFYQRKAVQALTESDREDSITAAHVFEALAVYTCGVGDWEESERFLSRALELFERYGDWSEWGTAVQMLGRCQADQGRFHRLADSAERLMAHALDRDALVEQSWSLNDQAEHVLFTRNDTVESLELGRRSLALLSASREPTAEAIARSLLAVTHFRRGDVTASQEEALRAASILGESQPTSFGVLVGYASSASALLSCWERSPEDASLHASSKTACQALRRFARVFPIGEPRAALYEGTHLWLRGRRRAAQRRWRLALARAETLGMAYEAAAAQLELGRHLAPEMRDTEEERRNLLTRAAEAFEHGGANFDLERTRRELSRTGVGASGGR